MFYMGVTECFYSDNFSLKYYYYTSYKFYGRYNEKGVTISV